jgi:C-terminal binding protein
MPDKPIVYISPGHMDPDYTLEKAGLGPDVNLRVMQNPDRGYMDGASVRDADAIMTWRTRIDANAIDQLERCKLIVRMGVGYDIVDVEAAAKKSIPVSNVPDYCTNEVADHTIALLLGITRGLPAYIDSVKQDEERWEWSAAGHLFRMTGKTLGIIGLGRIGIAVALRAKAFGLDVAFYDPYARDGMDRALGLRRLELDDLLAQADFLTLHTPLTNETRAMVNSDFLAKLKHGAYLVNTSRGGVLDANALEVALREGRVAAAALDVMPTEPPGPELALLKAWRAGEDWVKHRLIVTPHSAFYSEEGEVDMRVKATAAVREVLDGLPARNVVNM